MNGACRDGAIDFGQVFVANVDGEVQHGVGEGLDAAVADVVSRTIVAASLQSRDAPPATQSPPGGCEGKPGQPRGECFDGHRLIVDTRALCAKVPLGDRIEPRPPGSLQHRVFGVDEPEARCIRRHRRSLFFTNGASRIA
jgi:hypothetical protein